MALSKLMMGLLKQVSSPVIYSSFIPQLSSENIIIGTHDGSFHCDEALAISMLRLLPTYENSIVIRSRDPEKLLKCSIIVDVGAKYEPERNLFDHHQREFTGVLSGYNTKLSSAGLIYKHFGKEIIKHICQIQSEKSTIDDKLVDILYHRLYQGFIEHIDAIDNGIPVSDTPPKYHISTTLSNRVGDLNPAWNQPQSNEIYSEQFKTAMELTCSEFLSRLNSLYTIWWPARSIVENCLNSRFTVHSSGKIAVLDQFCPWKDHLFELESERNISGEILYMLYKDISETWRIQAVPEDPNSFNSRKKLPAPYCGLRDEVLSNAMLIPGCIFIHAGGFIGGHKTYDGALQIAIQAVEFNEDNVATKRKCVE